MKIACQSCQAKYTIADEKVLGKVVKIRCKKCGATIVVNGQETGDAGHASGNDEMTEVRTSSGDLGGQGGHGADADGWTVNVADDDQRTLTTHQVVAEFAKGTITDETYCWRDGMGDWLPLREIEELAAACGLTEASAFAQQPPPQAAASPRASVRPAASGASGASGGGLAGIFGSSPPAAMGGAQAGAAMNVPMNVPAARRAGGRAGGADLFGAAAEAGGENDVMTSAPQNSSGQHVSADDGKMTGQRNENSVLFSLNALTANEPAAKKNGGGASGGGLLGAAQGDGSGLIDIRALSSSMAASGPKKTNHADDIMNLGGGGAFSAALAAPVLTAPPLDSGDPNAPAAGGNKKIFLMFGALAVLLVLGMVVMFFLLQPKPAAPLAANPPEGTGTAASPAPPGTAAATAQAPTAPTAPTAAATPPPADTTAAVADNSNKATPPSVGGRHASGNGGGTSGAGNAPPAVDHSAPPPPPPPVANNSSLDQQMAKAMGGTSAPVNAAPAAATAPFDRGAASASLGAIADGVGSCKKPGGPTGDGHVSITFSPSGTVVSAIVDQPPYAGTAVGGCVAGKFRSAHVPAFAGSNLQIGKRFSIN